MENTQCWWCKETCTVCSTCRGIWADIPNCQACSGTGYECPNGDDNWEGMFFSFLGDPDSDEIFQWILEHRNDDPEAMTSEDIPYRERDDLGYLAFAVNTMGNRELGFDDAGLRRKRWYMHCLELAIDAGAERPEVMRLPLYSDIVRERNR